MTSTTLSHDVHPVHFDAYGKKLGMWIFLFTEVLLFGGLFLVYAAYRFLNHDAFHEGSAELNVVVGAINTVVLLTSSLTVAMSITALQRGDSKRAINLIMWTLILAGTFMFNKYYEWYTKWEHGLFPGMDHYKELPAGKAQFFNLYFFMTGLHAIHIIIGSILLMVIAFYIKKGTINQQRYTYLENGGLYWHLIDVIWIYLFPLFYLII
ncbi:cytochrome c oxidase subunit 3 family protein [Candidatus Falkowbacteria bacterium]|nr:cytochrome c oxidase subunit 3 family protein [Candidatus Falkowbacteria bacterium]